MTFGFCQRCIDLVADSSEGGVSPNRRVVIADSCSRCHVIMPISQDAGHPALQEVDGPLFVTLLYDDVVASGRIREPFKDALMLSRDGAVYCAGSSYPLYPPRLPARRRLFFAGDINVGMRRDDRFDPAWLEHFHVGGVYTTDSHIARFGPRAVVRLDQLEKVAPKTASKGWQ